MIFQAPLFLWALPLAGAPVLLHLFFRRKTRIVPFSTLVFFQKKEKFFSYRKKIREVLLLLLRVLTILFLILALAKPFIHGMLIGKNSSVDAVLILDDTMSMQRLLPGNANAFSLAKNQAEKVLETLSGKDGASLIFLSGKPGIPLTRERGRVLEGIRRAVITGCAGNFQNAFARASEELAGAPGSRKEIFCFSDFQKSALPSRKITRSVTGNAGIFLFPSCGRTENIRIALDEGLPSVLTAGKPYLIPFSIVNYSSVKRTVRFSLETGGKVLETKIAGIPPHGTVRESFSCLPVPGNSLSGRVFLDDADLPMDNEESFFFRVTDTGKILFLAQKENFAAWYYLAAAFDPRPGEAFHGFSVRKEELSSVRKNDLAGNRIVCIMPGRASAPALSSLLAEEIRKGLVVFAFPEESSSGRFYPELARHLSLSSPYEKSSRKTTEKGVSFMESMKKYNELLNLDLVQFRKIASLSPGGRILARTNSGKPLIKEYSIDKGKILFFAFGPDRGSSNWPELKSFPVVLVSLLDEFANAGEKTIVLECGSGPAEDRKYLPGIAENRKTDAERIIYRIPLRESDPEIVPSRKIPALFEAESMLFDPADDPAVKIASSRQGTALSGTFLLLSLLLALTELFLSLNLALFRRKGDV